MIDSFTLPLVGERPTVKSTDLLPADDDYMRRPTESNLRLFQLLPDSNHVAQQYTLAGITAPPCQHIQQGHRRSIKSSYTATALYTPTGATEYQDRVLACRLHLITDDHAHDDSMTAYHEAKLDAEFDDGERAAYTDWTDWSFDQDTINGHQRTTFSLRRPILVSRTSAETNVHRPVLVYAFALQTTPWGLLEIGTYQTPNPDPGTALNEVTALADLLSNRVERFPKPSVDDQWPLFHGHDTTKEEHLQDLRATIADLTTESTELADESRAAMQNIHDRFEAQYGVSPHEVNALIAELEERNEITQHSLCNIELH